MKRKPIKLTFKPRSPEELGEFLGMSKKRVKEIIQMVRDRIHKRKTKNKRKSPVKKGS